ncbi:unnamed protein product [Trichobilharzia regenti]|nr:unnamed protein product [Trichobilharzia regenti]
MFTLTYGALVANIVRDFDTDAEINEQLDKIGFNIGLKLVEDYLARGNPGRCNDFKETFHSLLLLLCHIDVARGWTFGLNAILISALFRILRSVSDVSSLYDITVDDLYSLLFVLLLLVSQLFLFSVWPFSIFLMNCRG